MIINPIIIMMRANIEEETYCLIRPLWLFWLIFDIEEETFPMPWGPTFSCHPRSRVRLEKNNEKIKEEKVIKVWAKSTKNHCSVSDLC